MCPDELLMELGMVRVQGGNNIKKCNMYDAYMRASTIPFKNALEMELMFAASQLENKARERFGYRNNPYMQNSSTNKMATYRRRVTLTESLKANAACIITCVLNATLHKGCSRCQTLHLSFVISFRCHCNGITALKPNRKKRSSESRI